MSGFFSKIRNWGKKEERKPGQRVKASELENCIRLRAEEGKSMQYLDLGIDRDQSTGCQKSSDHDPDSLESLHVKYSYDPFSDPIKPAAPYRKLEPDSIAARLAAHHHVENQVLKLARDWQPVEASDDFRVSYAHRKGGIPLDDKSILKRLRSSGKEIILAMGKKILRGDFNLTTISFPIKCMEPRTVLHNTIRAMLLDPLYLNRAAMTSDPVERLRLVMISRIASFIFTAQFLKPVSSKQMNPILGETISARCIDGSLFYAEQTNHHPPVSHFLVYGPANRYTCSGYYVFEAKAGLNSLKIINQGKRKVTFEDGQTITINCPNESFSSTFIGTPRNEALGPVVFIDEANHLEAIVNIGGIKGKPSDYLEGLVIRNGTQLISKLTGTYLGWLEFDGLRYWDVRFVPSFDIQFDGYLPSDSERRPDLQALKEGNLEQAQDYKESLEVLQRTDRALRTKGSKRR